MRAARVARLFVLIEPIKSLICELIPNERFSCKGREWKIYCCQLSSNSKMSLRCSTDYVKGMYLHCKCVPHVQNDYLSSFNQSNHWFVALSQIPIWCNTWFMHAKWQCHAHYPDKTTHHLMLPLGRQLQAIGSFFALGFALIVTITFIFRIFSVAGDFLILSIITIFAITSLCSARVASAWMQNVGSFWVLLKQCFLYPK